YWEGGGGEELGAARGGHSASQAASLPLPPLPWIKLCPSPTFGNPLLPLAHDPSPNPGPLFFGGGGARGCRNHSLQFSTKCMNSRHLILHPSLGLGPLHVSQVQNHCPRKRVWREEEKEIETE
uniref:Uncharacterized protein n=1 Tax=Pan troglodytes TaxID=9598 RepID=A0A2I3SE54_PANTR